MTQTLLTASPLTKNRDGFYVKQKGENDFWLGHRHGETGDLHEIRISEEFYNASVKESETIKLKYQKIL